MNIVYATRATIPFASAASLNSVQMCESLVELGHRVTLAIGRKVWRRGVAVRDWSSFYGFRPRFDVAKLWELPKTGFGFDAGVLRLAARRRALLYLRYPRLLGHRAQSRSATLLELHSDLHQVDRRRVASAFERGSLLGVVVITGALREHLLDDPTLRPFRDRFLVAPDAVNCSRFAHVAPMLNLKQIGYVGGLFPGKGVEQIFDLANLRPSLSFHVFGGRENELRRWRARIGGMTNLSLWGHRSPAEIPECFNRFGIALLPNQPSVRLPGGDDIGRFTSPMKLFEYMAAGRAIVASDLPGLREILQDGVNCLLVPHNDPGAWARAIDRLRTDPEMAHRIAARAKRDAVSRYSYSRRFQNILDRFAPTIHRRLSA